ncbi:hypothetical protein T439DRAFT_379745 [Meredithblackwellia eburnea MCA 4105]
MSAEVQTTSQQQQRRPQHLKRLSLSISSSPSSVSASASSPASSPSHSPRIGSAAASASASASGTANTPITPARSSSSHARRLSSISYSSSPTSPSPAHSQPHSANSPLSSSVRRHARFHSISNYTSTPSSQPSTSPLADRNSFHSPSPSQQPSRSLRDQFSPTNNNSSSTNTISEEQEHEHDENNNSGFLSPSRTGAAIGAQPTLTELNSDLLSFIAKKERRCLDLREELKRNEDELAHLKRKWEAIVAKSLASSSPPTTTSLPRPAIAAEASKRARSLAPTIAGGPGGAAAALLAKSTLTAPQSPSPASAHPLPPVPNDNRSGSATPNAKPQPTHTLDLSLLSSTFDPASYEADNQNALEPNPKHQDIDQEINESVQAAKAWVGGLLGKVIDHVAGIEEQLPPIQAPHPSLDVLKEEDEEEEEDSRSRSKQRRSSSPQPKSSPEGDSSAASASSVEETSANRRDSRTSTVSSTSADSSSSFFASLTGAGRPRSNSGASGGTVVQLQREMEEQERSPNNPERAQAERSTISPTSSIFSSLSSSIGGGTRPPPPVDKDDLLSSSTNSTLSNASSTNSAISSTSSNTTSRPPSSSSNQSAANGHNRRRSTFDMLGAAAGGSWRSLSGRWAAIQENETFKGTKRATINLVDSFERTLTETLGPLDIPGDPPLRTRETMLLASPLLAASPDQTFSGGAGTTTEEGDLLGSGGADRRLVDAELRRDPTLSASAPASSGSAASANGDESPSTTWNKAAPLTAAKRASGGGTLPPAPVDETPVTPKQGSSFSSTSTSSAAQANGANGNGNAEWDWGAFLDGVAPSPAANSASSPPQPSHPHVGGYRRPSLTPTTRSRASFPNSPNLAAAIVPKSPQPASILDDEDGGGSITSPKLAPMSPSSSATKASPSRGPKRRPPSVNASSPAIKEEEEWSQW